MSVASAPSSSPKQISAIKSPACVPTMAPPSSRCVSGSKRSLVNLPRAVGQCAPRRHPREDGFLESDIAGLGVLLRQTRPGDFRIGVGDGRNLARIEKAFPPGGVLGGHVSLMHGLVCEHRLADNVADRIDVVGVGAADLPVYGDEALVANIDASLLRQFACRSAAAGGPKSDRDAAAARRRLRLRIIHRCSPISHPIGRLRLSRDPIETRRTSNKTATRRNTQSAPGIRPSSISTTSTRAPKTSNRRSPFRAR